MTTPVDQAGEWETQAQVDDCLTEIGATMDQVRRWRREGLLPNVIQTPQAYDGSVVLYPIGTCAQIKAAAAFFKQKNRVEFVGLQLWRTGHSVDERHWRPRLRRFGRMADRILPLIRLLNERADAHEHTETLQDKAARLLPSNIILSRIKARLDPNDLAIFYRVLIECGIGEFGQFDMPSGDEKESRDKEATINAFDLENSKKHAVFDNKFDFVNALPLALKNTAEVFGGGNFTEAAEAPPEEIALALEDSRNALKIGLYLYEALRWVYGDGAFGLRLIAWLARKAPDTAIDGLILGMVRLRKIPNAILSSNEIVDLANQAEFALRASKQIEFLSKNDQRFSEVFQPHRIRKAFSDKTLYGLFLKEVRGASMRQLEEPPKVDRHERIEKRESN